MPVNITQQTICRVTSQQILYFSQHFAENFCLENACCVMFTDICSFDGHDFFESISYKTVFGNYVVFFLFLGPLTQHPYEFWDL